MLLWSGRHCCWCGQQRGLDIELDHIDPKLELPYLNQIDNAIPVCYDCHGKLEFSRAGSPRGSKFSILEIKERRDQIYEEKTRHLVPVLAYGPLNDANLKFPQVRFYMKNNDGGLCVRARCVVEIFVSRKLFGTPTRHYAGDHSWACNPGLAAIGWFDLSDPSRLRRNPRYRGVHPSKAEGRDLRLRVHLTITDALQREHNRLPVEWYYDWKERTWVYDPWVGRALVIKATAVFC